MHTSFGTRRRAHPFDGPVCNLGIRSGAHTGKRVQKRKKKRQTDCGARCQRHDEVNERSILVEDREGDFARSTGPDGKRLLPGFPHGHKTLTLYSVV